MTAVNYILSFLLYGKDNASELIGYTADTTLWPQYRLVIVPERDSLLDLYLPDLDLRPTLEKVGDTLVVRQDLVYNTFFLISRAEEMLNTQRDEHQRFLARHSILGKQNRLLMPIVDEYSRFLMKALELRLPPSKINKVILTHDVDILTRYRTLRSLIGAFLRHEGKKAISAWSNINNDPAWTFPHIISTDRQFRLQSGLRTEVIYFFKNTNAYGYDAPHYRKADLKRLIHLLADEDIRAGLHSSYASGEHYDLCHDELELFLLRLRQLSPEPINRTHYLRSTGVEHLRALVKAGIKEDYTMAFADRAGFRLATTRPVRWIDPETAQLSDLTLFPLNIMDCTLSDKQYMGLTEEEAYYYSQQIIDKVKMHHGTLTLLFHNQLLTPQSYHSRLYNEILDYLLLSE